MNPTRTYKYLTFIVLTTFIIGYGCGYISAPRTVTKTIMKEAAPVCDENVTRIMVECAKTGENCVNLFNTLRGK